MLALSGDADDSLGEFLGLIDGTDAIRYWEPAISDWADIAGATTDDDYTLRYQTSGDLAGYTLLTVTNTPPDINGDGVVDIADLALIGSQWGTAGSAPRSADISPIYSGDGIVDIADLALIGAHWDGVTAASSVNGTTASVPAPTAFPVGLVCLAGLLRRRPC